jgi:hypothetical protein
MTVQQALDLIVQTRKPLTWHIRHEGKPEQIAQSRTERAAYLRYVRALNAERRAEARSKR